MTANNVPTGGGVPPKQSRSNFWKRCLQIFSVFVLNIARTAHIAEAIKGFCFACLMVLSAPAAGTLTVIAYAAVVVYFAILVLDGAFHVVESMHKFLAKLRDAQPRLSLPPHRPRHYQSRHHPSEPPRTPPPALRQRLEARRRQDDAEGKRPGDKD